MTSCCAVSPWLTRPAQVAAGEMRMVDGVVCVLTDHAMGDESGLIFSEREGLNLGPGVMRMIESSSRDSRCQCRNTASSLCCLNWWRRAKSSTVDC